jgi:raffinose/stachyose/melibiose transport system substrate-binding protein
VRAAVLATAALALVLGAASSLARGGQVTVTLLANISQQAALEVLIPNFERVYPDITVNASYVPTTSLTEVETTEIAAGNAPDIFITNPGNGSAIGISELAHAGDLAPMIRKPWTSRSLPAVTSLDKAGQALYAFTPVISPEGIFTNDQLFAKLGLKVPQTFAQLLEVCQKAKVDGTPAILLSGASGVALGFFLKSLAVATLYQDDTHWTAKLKAGTATFDGTVGWHPALQDFVDLNSAGCFQPGSTSETSATTTFAQGHVLMTLTTSGQKGMLDAAGPQFPYSFHPVPDGRDPAKTDTLLMVGLSFSVNAHSSPASQAAAQTRCTRRSVAA